MLRGIGHESRWWTGEAESLPCVFCLLHVFPAVVEQFMKEYRQYVNRYVCFCAESEAEVTERPDESVANMLQASDC